MQLLYKIIALPIDEVKKFVNFINERLKQGWELRGDLIIYTGQNLYQVLTKLVNENEPIETQESKEAMMLKLDILQRDISTDLYIQLLDFFKEEKIPIHKCIEYADQIARQFSEQIVKKAADICGG